MAEMTKKRTARIRSYSTAEIRNVSLALVVVIIGALTIGLAITKVVASEELLYGNTNPTFQFLVGLALLVVGVYLFPPRKRGFK